MAAIENKTTSFRARSSRPLNPTRVQRVIKDERFKCYHAEIKKQDHPSSLSSLSSQRRQIGTAVQSA